MTRKETPHNLLSIVDTRENLVLGNYYLFDDEAAIILELVEIFTSRREK